VKQWHLIVVGSGDPRSFRTLAKSVKAEALVHFVGWQPSPYQYLLASDVFMLPTAYETFSLVTYEAAAAGLPLLVSKVSGVEDLLMPGHNGWFISPGEEGVRATAERLEVLASNVPLRRAMGLNSRHAVAEFTWARMIDAYRVVYQRVQAAEGSS